MVIMTRAEFDIACKLAIGFVLEGGGMYPVNNTRHMIAIYGITETGVDFNDYKGSEFMNFEDFMDIVPHINNRMYFRDIINSYNESGVISSLAIVKIIP